MTADARKTIEKVLKARAPGYDAEALAGAVLAELAAAGLMIINRGDLIRQSSVDRPKPKP